MAWWLHTKRFFENIFFFLHLAGDSVTSFQSRSWGSHWHPDPQNHPPLPLLPCPTSAISIKGLAWSVDRWRGKCDFEEKKKKKCKKPVKCKGTENSKRWWNQAIMNQTKSLFHSIIQHIWSIAHKAEKIENQLSKNEVLHCFLEVVYILNPFLYVFLPKLTGNKKAKIKKNGDF